MFLHKRSLVFSLGLLTTLLTGIGCSTKGPQRPGAVNEQLAQNSLSRALESWKKGSTPQAFQADNPAIVVQDMDWLAGFRLVKYRMLERVLNDNANLHCPVKLTLVNPQGQQVEKEVRYIVGTDPAITVFREIAM